MITTFLIATLVSFIGFFIGLLPTGVLPVAVSSSFSYLSGILNTFNFIFPISHLFIVFILVITVDIVVWVFHSFLWVYHKIRGI